MVQSLVVNLLYEVDFFSLKAATEMKAKALKLKLSGAMEKKEVPGRKCTYGDF